MCILQFTGIRRREVKLPLLDPTLPIRNLAVYDPALFGIHPRSKLSNPARDCYRRYTFKLYSRVDK